MVALYSLESAKDHFQVNCAINTTNSALEMRLNYLEMLLQVARAGRNNARRKKVSLKRQCLLQADHEKFRT